MPVHIPFRNRKRTVGVALLAFFGLTASYFVFYFMLFKPSLPPMDPSAERYMAKVKQEDWAGVVAMHADRGSGEAAVEQWKRVRKEFGPIRSVEHLGTRTTLFPFFTRGMTAYSLRTEGGELLALLDMKARWGFWTVRDAKATFQPPQPFRQGGPQASRS